MGQIHFQNIKKTKTLNYTTSLNQTTTLMCKMCHKSAKQRERDIHIIKPQKKPTALNKTTKLKCKMCRKSANREKDTNTLSKHKRRQQH